MIEYTPEVFVDLMTLINTIIETKTKDPELQKIVKLWDQEITVTGDLIFCDRHKITLPKNLTVQGNFGRFACPRSHKEVMPETITCEDYVFRYESILPTKSLTCKTISFPKGAKLPDKLPEITVKDGLAGIQKEYLPQILAQAPKGFVPLTKSQVRQKEFETIMAASRKKDLTKFKDLILELPVTKKCIEALDNEGNYKAIVELSRSSKMAIAKFTDIVSILDEKQDAVGMEYAAKGMAIEILIKSKLSNPNMKDAFFKGLEHNKTNAFELSIQSQKKSLGNVNIILETPEELLLGLKEHGWTFSCLAAAEALKQPITWFQENAKFFSGKEIDSAFTLDNLPWFTKELEELGKNPVVQTNLICYGAQTDWRPSEKAKRKHPELKTIEWMVKPKVLTQDVTEETAISTDIEIN